ncbi:MAG: Alpha/Beta hydrolase protein [Linnemannia elongata]|nr:MAG: Alpha/Beta hydrolase protein [Linnemannia elongata]
MHILNHALIGAAAKIPASCPTPVLSFSPVVLPCPDRRVDLQLHVSAPSTGDALPVILLSHGHGQSNYLSSLEGYRPLADFWAGHGFVVIQPTHLNSKFLSLSLDATNIRELFLESRAQDMTRILDQLDAIETAVPLLKGRLDKTKVAVAGHSMGALTASVLLGATNVDPRDGTKTQLLDKRIKAGVVIGGTGNGGSDLSDAGRARLPFYSLDFNEMRTPALVVWGDEDVSPHLTTRGADWHADPYNLSPGPKDSFMVKGGKHGFGGISGWDAGETLDESPERLAAVQRMTWAYLKSQLYEGDDAWGEACKALMGLEELGKVESKSK